MPGWLQRGRAGHNRVGFRSKPAKTLSTRARGVGAIRLMVRPANFLIPLGNPTLLNLRQFFLFYARFFLS